MRFIVSVYLCSIAVNPELFASVIVERQIVPVEASFHDEITLAGCQEEVLRKVTVLIVSFLFATFLRDAAALLLPGRRVQQS